jgi:outer membrane protein assembly factor BamB
MKKLLVGTMALGMSAALLFAQPGTFKVHTCPKLPSREALERMGLKMAWSARLLMNGNRDGIATIQVLPWDDNPQLFVQSYSGMATLFDAETGAQIWQVQVGKRYTPSFTAGANSNSIFVSRRNVLYVLNRANGLNRLYSVDKFTGIRTNGIELPYMPTAAPVADEIALYFVMSTKAVVFRLPVYGAQGEALRHITVVGDEGEPVLPEAGLLYPVGEEFINFAPLVGGKQFTVVTAPGTIVSLNRFEQKVSDEYSIDSKVAAMPGQHGIMAYIGTDRGTLHAINMENSKLLWRYMPGGDIRAQPAILDRDVFVVADRVGLLRVDRLSGQEVWLAKQFDRFLAANDKFVYALQPNGEFHVLDYMRGSSLAHYDLKDWTVPMSNELTDRIYLASNDGQIICLRNRELKLPMRYHATEPRVEKNEPKKVEKKDEKPDDKKDDKKDDKAGWNWQPNRPAFARLSDVPLLPIGQPAATSLGGEQQRRRLP